MSVGKFSVGGNFFSVGGFCFSVGAFFFSVGGFCFSVGGQNTGVCSVFVAAGMADTKTKRICTKSNKCPKHEVMGRPRKIFPQAIFSCFPPEK